MNTQETPQGGWRFTINGVQVRDNCIASLFYKAKQAGVAGDRKQIVQQIVQETMPYVGQASTANSLLELPPQPDKNAYVLLGRYGDIMHLLPALQIESERVGHPVPLVVSKQFAAILDGVDYVNPVIWEGDYRLGGKAGAWAARMFRDHRIVNCTVCASDMKTPPIGWSYDRDIWIRSDVQAPPHSVPLLFNKRDYSREEGLCKQVSFVGKPNIVLALEGNSSPFRHANEIRKALRDLLPKANFIDVSHVAAYRIYDLLGIFERADVLIATDSAPLHLAGACGIKTIALVNDENTPWHQSSGKAHHFARIPYSKALRRVEEIARLCAETALESRLLAVSSSKSRDERALRSWASMSVVPFLFKRSGADLGDAPVPYIRDMVSAAIENATDNDAVVLLNADILLTEGANWRILYAVKNNGCCYAQRRDFKEVSRYALNEREVGNGPKYSGADLFAFSPEWWSKHGESFPDMLLGREAWDMVMRDLMRISGGIELDRVCYHEMHDSFWLQKRDCTGNKHNLVLAKAWLAEHNLRWN